MRRWRIVALVLILWPLGLSWPGYARNAAHAQSTMPGVDEFASALVQLTTRVWKGQRVSWPDAAERPSAAMVRRSLWRPLAVHVVPSLEEREKCDSVAALHALETAYDLLTKEGWSAPVWDTLGGAADFDLYLSAAASEDVAVFADRAAHYSFLDETSAFAVIRADLDPERLLPCVVDAYAQAMLLGQDPAEAVSWRRATAAWLAWRITGQFGCTSDVAVQQQQPWRAWTSHQGYSGNEGHGGGALMLALASSQYRDEHGIFFRELWQLARQRTWEGSGLRGAPDLWMALHRVLEWSEQRLTDVVADFAVDRFFLGSHGFPLRRASLLAGKESAHVPFVTVARSALPVHLPPVDPPLEPYGSSYVVVDLRKNVDEPDPTAKERRLRIWLRGEYGVEWGLSAVRLDSDGRELGRLDAPPRKGVPRSFLPVELSEPTSFVLVVATNLSSRIPDADEIDENVRAARLIVDLESD